MEKFDPENLSLLNTLRDHVYDVAADKGFHDPDCEAQGFHFTGNVTFHVAYGDKPDLSIRGGCRAACSVSQIRSLSQRFTYKVYDASNNLTDRVSGPGSSDWVPLGAMAKELMDGAITFEDPGFLYHKGFIAEAYRNSLIDNLKVGRFHRGGSTISMQLAKNL